MPVSLWQHVATWFLNYHSIKFHDYHNQLSCSSLATQSGHGEGVHLLYASDARLPSGIDFYAFFDMMHASGVWHSLIGFSYISQPSLLKAMKCRGEINLPTTLPTTLEKNFPVHPRWTLQKK
jgi:hypothetical protein